MWCKNKLGKASSQAFVPALKCFIISKAMAETKQVPRETHLRLVKSLDFGCIFLLEKKVLVVYRLELQGNHTVSFVSCGSPVY